MRPIQSGLLNRTIHDNVARIGADTSLTLAVRDYKNGEVQLSGQHEEMVVVRGGGEIDLVDTLELGFPIGLEDDISDFIHEKRIQLKPGEGIVLYTDGFTEAERSHWGAIWSRALMQNYESELDQTH